MIFPEVATRTIGAVAQRYLRVPGGEVIVSTIPPLVTLPAHQHAEAQFGFAFDGDFDLLVGPRVARIAGSRGYVLAANVVHGARNERPTPVHALDVKLLAPAPADASHATVDAAPSARPGRAGFVEFRLPFGTVLYRRVAAGERLEIGPPPESAAYIAEVPVAAPDATVIAPLRAPHRVEGGPGGAHVVEVRVFPEAKLVSECARFDWRADVQHGTAVVCEGSDAARRALVAQFEAAGFRTIPASTACQGVAIAAEQYPEIFVLDVDLPSPPLEHVLVCLHGHLPLTKIVALTGRGSLASAASVIRHGATTYLPKPTTADLVLASLGYSLASARRPAERAKRPFTLSRATWEYLQQVLHATPSRAEAARRLGIQPRSLRRMLLKNAPVE